MKIVSWNANKKFREKIHLFDPAKFDVLVVQECENTESSSESYKAAGWDFLWIGDNKNGGLGVFVPINHPIERISWEFGDCRYFLPVRVNKKQIIIGVWTKGGTKGRRSKSITYAGQITRFLDSYSENIDAKNTLLVGDFNSSSKWDKRHCHANHTKNDSRLGAIGIRSLWHTQYNEIQGLESKPTYFMYRHQDKPYHIDYAYIPQRFLESSSIEIGCKNHWLQYSDHMPLFIDYNG